MPVWKALTAISFGGTFAIIGFAIYVVSQIDWHPPDHACSSDGMEALLAMVVDFDAFWDADLACG